MDDSYTVHGQRALSPLDNDYDTDGNGFYLWSLTQPQHGSVSSSSSTMLSYAVASGYVGSDSFTYTIRDTAGNFATATINITAVNQSPVAVTDSYTVHGQISFYPAANDYDPDSDGVSFKVLATNPQHGSVVVFPDGLCGYTATYGYTGPDSFTYKIQDGLGAVTTGTVNINVVNQGPVAVTDSYTVHGQASFYPTANDYDPDNDGVSFKVLATNPQHGSVVVFPDGLCGYMATYGYTGPDSFTYKIQDGLGAVTTGTVNINVVNQPPIAVPDIFFWKWGDPLRPTQNDIDPENDGVAFQTITANPLFGTLNLSIAPDTFGYIPGQNFPGFDIFLYTIRDGWGAIGSPGVSLIFAPGDSVNLGNPACKGVGKPVDVTNGNMYLAQADYYLPSVGPGLAISRSYNSKSQAIGLLGRGWATDYDDNLVIDNTYLVHFRQGDGRVIYFFRGASTGAFTPVIPDFHGQVTQTASGFTLTLQDNSGEQFDANGRLLSLFDANGNTTSLTYGANGFLSTVTDPFGRSLNVTTNSNGRATSIADTTGTIATYTYGGGNELSSVTYADNSGFQFSYDGSYRLLTVTDALNNVVESHTYDGQGRAITSEQQGGVEHFTLNYVSDTETDVTDVLSHVTKYLRYHQSADSINEG